MEKKTYTINIELLPVEKEIIERKLIQAAREVGEDTKAGLALIRMFTALDGASENETERKTLDYVQNLSEQYEACGESCKQEVRQELYKKYKAAKDMASFIIGKKVFCDAHGTIRTREA